MLEALGALDPDLSRAIVRLAQPLLAEAPHPPAELATFGRHSVIVIHPSRTLERRTGVELLRLPDGRALISFDRATTIPGLELSIKEALDERQLPAADREIFASIGAILRSARRSTTVDVLQRNVIVLQTRRAAASIRRISK